MSDVSFIHMSSLGNMGEADIAVPLAPDEKADRHRRRSPLRTILDLTLTQLLAFICAILAFVIIGLAITSGVGFVLDSNQRGHIHDQNVRIDNLVERIHNQDVRINQINAELQSLEGHK